MWKHVGRILNLIALQLPIFCKMYFKVLMKQFQQFLAILASKKFEDFHSLQEMIYIFNIFHFLQILYSADGTVARGRGRGKGRGGVSIKLIYFIEPYLQFKSSCSQLKN